MMNAIHYALMVTLPLIGSTTFASEEEAAPRPAAHASAAPTTGVPALVTGGVMTGIGGLNLLTAPVCLVLSTSSQRNACLGVSLGVGAGLALTGIVLLAVGGGQRARFKRWQQVTPGLTLLPGGAGLALAGTF